jgi:hypothetical protein
MNNEVYKLWVYKKGEWMPIGFLEEKKRYLYEFRITSRILKSNWRMETNI